MTTAAAWGVTVPMSVVAASSWPQWCHYNRFFKSGFQVYLTFTTLFRYVLFVDNYYIFLSKGF